MRWNKWSAVSGGLVILAIAAAGAASLWLPSAELAPEKVVLNWNGRIIEVPQADSRYQRLIDEAEEVIESTAKGPCKCPAELTGDVPDKPGLLLMLPPGQSVRMRRNCRSPRRSMMSAGSMCRFKTAGILPEWS
ncbi:hypothetical protein P4H65_25450 [Paenibacillus chitinolyticus]|uniref:hypothetical protein n=1 Tax=Paenibacillus chitinolyticus TaxID=79263 RepID=UPI002DBA4DDE|nr:hypothetical protein [Paenibacillus chitinolyticus]MEC0249132.1 hypothetical protein [Paenibacillus chitinolyticus]